MNKNMSIEDLDFSLRTWKCLRKAGIETLGELAVMSADELFTIPNMGRKSLDEIASKLQERGMILEGYDPSFWQTAQQEKLRPLVEGSCWAEIRNNFFKGEADIVRPVEGDILATISIDAWETQDDWEEGFVIACVLLSKHGDILVDYRDNVARTDKDAQRAISEAKDSLRAYFHELQQDYEAVQRQEAGVSLWGRLGISLNVTPEELAVLKGDGCGAQDLFVDLVRSDRCYVSGETYFPADCNEEHLGDFDGELEFHLDCDLHKSGEEKRVNLSDKQIQAAEQCLIDNGIETEEVQTVLQALGYILLDDELYPEVEHSKVPCLASLISNAEKLVGPVVQGKDASVRERD